MTDTPQRARQDDPDREAILAFRNGDASAFDQLVRRHQDRIHRLARRLLSDAEAALDAAQETFVKAWRALDRFEGQALFSTWLTRIAINQCRNELRRRKTVKHTRPLSLDAPIPGTEEATRAERIEGTEPQGWETARGHEVAAAIRVAMDRLEPEAREVLLLREVEDLSYEDVAEVLAVPVGTVRSRLHRARAELRRHLEPVLQG